MLENLRASCLPSALSCMPLRSVATLEERPRGLMAWHGAWGAETQAIRLPDSLGLALLGGGEGAGTCRQGGKTSLSH